MACGSNTNNYGNANVASYLPLYGGNILANAITGTLTTGSQPAITTVGQLTGVSTTGNIIGYGNLDVTSNISTSVGNIDVYQGNVNILTGGLISEGQITSGGNIVAIDTFEGAAALITGNTTTNAIFTDNYFYANGAPFAGSGGNGTGNYGNSNVAAYLPTFTGNVGAGNVVTVGTQGNITGAKYVSANYFVGDGGNLQLTTANTHIIPAIGNAYTLGNATNPWQSLYVSGNTIYLANVPLSTGPTGNTLYVSNVAVVSLDQVNDGNIGFTGNITGNAFIGNTYGANVIGEVAVANVVSNPLQPVITQVGVLSALTANTIDVNGQFTANANAQFNGNVYFAGNVDIAGNINQISGNSGQFFGNAATGFNALYAGVPAGYDLLQQEVTQFSTNYNGYAQVNARNINGGDQATTDYVVTANDGTDTTNYINMGMAGSGYNGLLANNSLGNSLFATDGYLYTKGNVTGGNLVLGTSQANGVVRIITGASDLANVRAAFTDAGLSVQGNITGNYLLGNGAFITGLPAGYANADVFSYLGSNSNVVILTTGNITTSANIAGNYILGNGAFLTGLPEQYGNANVAAYLPTYTGNISAGNIAVANNITANANISAGNIAVANNITANANISAGNVNANFFYGNGAGLTGVVAVAGSIISNGTSNITIPVANGNIQFNIAGVDVGYLANNGAVAFGPLAGRTPIGANAVAIGYHAGGDSQASGAVSVGALAGNALQATQSVAVGYAAGQTSQGSQSVAIGFNAGAISQGTTSVAIGPNAGGTSQGNTAIAIGQLSGSTGQNVGGIAIGSTAARSNQGTRAIAIGDSAAYSGAGTGAISMGYQSAYFGSGTGAISIGYQAAAVGGTQGTQSIAIGQSAAGTSQGNGAVALGVAAGSVNQGANAIAIGSSAGANAQGNNSIAIGRFAGQTTQVANSIILNAGTTALNANVAGFFVNPVRQDTGNVANVVYFNITTRELTYGPISYGNANVSNLLSNFGSNTISTTGNITANTFFGNGAGLTGIAGTYSNANVVTLLSSFGSNTISTLGNVASGNITAGSINTAYTEITTFEADGIEVTLTFVTQATVPYPAGSKIVVAGLNSSFPGTDGTYVVTAGDLDSVAFNSTYAITAPTAPSNLSTIRGVLNSFVSATGNITTDSYFIGNGSQLTGLPAGYGNADVSTYLASGDDTQGFITSGNVNATAFNGDGQGLLNINAVTLGNALPNVAAVANTVVVRNANASVVANTFIGSGSTLTNINAANITGLYGNINVAAGSNINFAEGAKLYSIPSGGLAGTTEINGADNRGISVTAGGNVPGSSYAQIQWVDDIADYDPFGYANAITNWVYVQNDGIYFETIDAFNTPGYYHSMKLDTDGLLTVPGEISGSGNIDIGTNNFIGNGALLTGLPATYSNADVATYLASGNNTSNIITTGNISASYYTGNGSQLTGIINVIPAVGFTANVTGNNQSFTNVVLGSYAANTDITLFYNGALLTSDYYTLTGDTLTITTPIFAGDNINIPQVNVGNVTATVTTGYGNSNVGAYLTTYTGNISASNLTANTATVNNWAFVPQLWFVGKLTAAQTIPAAADTLINWTNVNDPKTWWNGTNQRLTPARIGWYQVDYQLNWATSGAGGTGQLNTQIRVNGTDVGFAQDTNNQHNGLTMTQSRMIYLATVTDYFTFTVYTTNGQDIMGGTTGSQVSVRWIST